MIIETDLFIGGPWDGRRLILEDYIKNYYVPIYTPLAPVSVPAEGPVDVDKAHYVRDVIGFAQTGFRFWRLRYSTPEKCLELLFQNYASFTPVANPRRD